MAYNYDKENNLIFSGIIEANDFHEVTKKYKKEMPGYDYTCILNKGDLITADAINELINSIRDYADNNGYIIHILPENVKKEDIIEAFKWGQAVKN